MVLTEKCGNISCAPFGMCPSKWHQQQQHVLQHYAACVYFSYWRKQFGKEKLSLKLSQVTTLWWKDGLEQRGVIEKWNSY